MNVSRMVVGDFIAVGDISIKVMALKTGPDEVPVRQLLEQIVAKLCPHSF